MVRLKSKNTEAVGHGMEWGLRIGICDYMRTLYTVGSTYSAAFTGYGNNSIRSKNKRFDEYTGVGHKTMTWAFGTFIKARSRTIVSCFLYFSSPVIFIRTNPSSQRSSGIFYFLLNGPFCGAKTTWYFCIYITCYISSQCWYSTVIIFIPGSCFDSLVSWLLSPSVCSPSLFLLNLNTHLLS